MTSQQGNVHNAADPPYEAFIRRIFAKKKKNVLIGFTQPFNQLLFIAALS